MSKIPAQIVDFSLYNGNERLIGHGSEITLPTVTSKTATAELAAGDIDLPGMRTENMEMEIPFNVFDSEAASVISLTEVSTVIIRSAAQRVNTSSHNFVYGGLKVTAKGFAKEIELGTLKRSDKMDSNITMTLTYIKVEDDKGNVFMEIDKLNGTFIINGKDVRDGISKFL